MIKNPLDYLNLLVDVIIDRPLNSLHPKHVFRYEANYGFMPNTTAPDGEEIDAYVLGVEKPLEKFHGKCIAVIHRTNDNDDKLVVIPKDMGNISEIIIGLVVFIVALPVLFLGAPFLPSYIKNGKVKLESLFNLLRENSCKKFMDLGSGDGRVVIDFAKAGFESYGVEINPLLVLWSKLKIKKLGLKNAKIKWGNIWPTDLSGFDSVFIFQ